MDMRPVDGKTGTKPKWVGIKIDPKDKTILNIEATKPFGFNAYGHGANTVFWVPGYVCQWVRSNQFDTFLKLKLDKEIKEDLTIRYVQSGTLVIRDMDDMYLPHDFEMSLSGPPVAKEAPILEEASVVPSEPGKTTVIPPVAKEPQKKKPTKKV